MNTCEISINQGTGCHQAGVRRRWTVLRILALLETWHERSQHRRQLREMPEHLLRDIGISAADVYRETRKPFWRA